MTMQLTLDLPVIPADPPVLRATCGRHGWGATCGLCAQWEQWRMSRTSIWYGYISADKKRITTWPGVTLGRITSMTIGQRRWCRQGYYRMQYVQVTACDGSMWWGKSSAGQDLVVLRRYGKERTR